MPERPGPGRRVLVGIVAGLVMALATLGLARAESAPQPLLRISTENKATHVQTRVIERFLVELDQRTGGRLSGRLHHGAELFRDRDVLKALAEGKVEMAVPGTWQMDRFQPDVALFQLPMFYGRSQTDTTRLRDGELGRVINAKIEQRLGVHVLGRWIDLGFSNIYSLDRPIGALADIAGKRIRIAGSDGSRIRALGAQPVAIPWPDLPAALDQGLVDAVVTTHESFASAKLWEHGMRHCFEDGQNFAQYVPLISIEFWNRLPQDLRTALSEAWDAIVEEARTAAMEAQTTARLALIAHGVRIVAPVDAVSAEWRRKVMAIQPDIVATKGIDPALVAAAAALLGEGPP